MTTVKELNIVEQPNWCPGCGNFGILIALKDAIAQLDVPQENVLQVSGIGCSGKLPHWIKTYGFHGVHGRALPVATAAKLSNHKLTVIADVGDGDCYSIGTNHFIHAARRNINITCIVHDNQIYGLTKGQAGPTTGLGMKTKSTPRGSIEYPIDPLQLAITSGATFVARGYAGDTEHLASLIVSAVKHKGFSLIDVLQPCVTFNKKNTFDWFKKRVYKLDKKYDPSNKEESYKKAGEWGRKIPIGIIYKEKKPTYSDELIQIKRQPLVMHNINNVSIKSLQEELM
ncbi:2-oxoacid:ferredoxin oxidoreductase subunit beta [Candidatus Woesearchaeota archaeon]|nr:2-oxoacid:ferredoxin oxidoreductase subunit beta [Candidatus Woesearchaeota archaeon]